MRGVLFVVFWFYLLEEECRTPHDDWTRSLVSLHRGMPCEGPVFTFTLSLHRTGSQGSRIIHHIFKIILRDVRFYHRRRGRRRMMNDGRGDLNRQGAKSAKGWRRKMDFERGVSARELGKTRRSPVWHGTAKRGNL